MQTQDLPEQIEVFHRNKINLPVESASETFSLVPIECGDVLFRLTNEPTFARHLVVRTDSNDAAGRENLPAFSQLEMYNYLKDLLGVEIFPDNPEGFTAFATVATANSTGDGALADALQIFYGPKSPHKVYVSKTLMPGDVTAYGSKSDKRPGHGVTLLDPIRVEDLSFRPSEPHPTTLFDNYKKLASDALRHNRGAKVDYFCGYGCITIPQSEDHKHKIWTHREEWQTRISLVNLLIAARVLKTGGNFCNKIQDAHSRVSMDLAYITSRFFDKVVFYEPPSMGWIGRRYIIGIGFRGYSNPSEEANILRWLDDLKDKYEEPKGLPLTLLHPDVVPGDFQRDWEYAMEMCDQQVIEGFTNVFTFVVENSEIWKRANVTEIRKLFEGQWRTKVNKVWSEIKGTPEWNTRHLSVISKRDLEKMRMPAHYVECVMRHTPLLYAMSLNEVVRSWVYKNVSEPITCAVDHCE